MSIRSILIIGTPRSGTTSLLNTLSNAFKFKRVFEPFNYNIPNSYDYPFLIDESVVKICPFQTPVEFGMHSDFLNFVKTYSREFDRTILLTRKNNNEHLESWHKSISKKESLDDLKIYIDIMYEISKELAIPITEYNELYGMDRNKSLDIIKSWNLNMNNIHINEHLNPKFRYRYFSENTKSLL